MADPQKGTSLTSNSKKKSPSVDEDFGKNFLSSWKPKKMGKDAIDFDVETTPRNKKKTFNFDKLDDFELGGDFDKLSSFKVDMPDLDFSSPLKKTEKPKEKSCKELVPGKQESKQEKFSFSFDFNELDRFSLDSNLLKGEKRPGKCADGNAPNCSFKHDRDQDSRSNSVTGTDVFQDQETKKILNTNNMATSKPENLKEPSTVNGANPSIYRDLGHHGYEAQLTTEKQLTVAENKTETHSSDGHKEQSDGTCFTQLYAERATQDLSIQSVFGDASVEVVLPQLLTGLASSDAVKADSAREHDNSMRLIASSQSRNSSPVKSYNSRSWRETSIIESSNTSGEFQECQGNQNEVSGGNAVLSEPRQGQNNVENASITNISQKTAHIMKNTGDKKNSSLPSPLHRDSRIVKSMPVNEKTTIALPFMPLNKSADNVSQLSASLTPKQLDSIHNWKIKETDICRATENRESKQSNEQAENQKGGILKSYEKGLTTKDASVILGRKRNDMVSDTSSFQLKTSNMPKQTAASSTAKDIIPNLVSGTSLMKSSKIISVETKNICLKDDMTRDVSSLMISRLNSNTQNSRTQKEAKSVRFSMGNLELSLTSAPKKANSVITEKCALLSAPLKRKTREESTADPETSNPLKRVMESPTGRKLYLVSPTTARKLVPRTENPEACQNDSCVKILTSNGSPELGILNDFEVPILIEKDGNVEKAEACAKELGDICNMLRKKQEEAKELLVRAIVNNNNLLMLNHPMFDEKIRALQRFATSLQSKEF